MSELYKIAFWTSATKKTANENKLSNNYFLLGFLKCCQDGQDHLLQTVCFLLFHTGGILVKKLVFILLGWDGTLECSFLLHLSGCLFSFMDCLQWILAK